jgi:hypothetical protein
MIGQWRIGKWSYGQMSAKSTYMAQMDISMCGRRGQRTSKRGICIHKTVKFRGGKIMVWGCMRWDGPGILCEVEGNMDAKQYVL